MALKSLTNLAYSDRELLLAIDRCIRRNGHNGNGRWSDTCLAADVAEDLGITSNGRRTPAGTVSIRFSWMATHKPDCPRGCPRHYGFIQRIDPREFGGKMKDSPRWMITEKGYKLLKGKLRKSIQNALESMDPGEQLLTLRDIAQRGYVDADETYAAAIRREWLHQSARRPR